MAGGQETHVTSQVGTGSSSTTDSHSHSTSFIPNYSETPILESIAKYAENMAPQVYQWGMDQWGKNQGDIQQLLDTGRSYASPARIAADMGQAEAGVQMAGNKALDAHKRDLESYGIDPSSGRYAALDAGERVMNAASAAGAGNQQRQADINTGQALTQAGVSAEEQNMGMGIQSENAAKGYLDTGMSLKYSPLGTVSDTQSKSQSATTAQPIETGSWTGGTIHGGSLAKGGYISPEASPSHGQQTDDIPARLNAGEFVIPKDVVAWKGHDFFRKLIEQSRKHRVTAGQQNPHYQQAQSGYNEGGAI